VAPGDSGRAPMLITKLRTKECREFLERIGFGRLGCANNNRPYIVPVYFIYEHERLYFFSTVGQKIAWMRENPLVCLEADEIHAHDDWVSVIALGRYVEIPNTEEDRKGWEHAHSLFQKRSLWWQSGYTASQIRKQPKPAVPIFYCIVVEQLNGLRGSPDFSEPGKRRGAPSRKS
jgi:nitroimidazol reductase NimA-like FMN-containing flavoprotein (pyridoxamine 5'-phosphate oxidase superfamily)